MTDKKQAATNAKALAKAQKMKASEMSKAILEAVDLLTEHKLERLEFDKTLVCTIEDDTNKKKGEYIVTDGSTSFTAYSDITIYMNGLRVYVTVPNGDFDNKKIITGRYIDSENSEYYTYKPPFEDYLDMSGNLIKDNIEKGLVANHPKDKEIVLWEVDNFTQGKGYTLLGIKADFRSWLSSYKTKAGEYGLRLDIKSRETSTSQGADKFKNYSCELTNNDMYGNPYNFETYYSQEKTFDITKISEIVSMKLIFFQKPGTFKDKNGKDIPYDTIGNKISAEKLESDRLKERRELKVGNFEKEEDYYKALEDIDTKYDELRKKLRTDLPANLFVKNPYVSIGYAEQDFEEDTVLIMTMDSKTYDATSSKNQNTKTVQARWIHFIEEEGETKDIVSIDYEDEIPDNAEIHWYRYFLSEGLDDEIAGVFWDEIEDNKNKLSYTFYPDINAEFERIKVIVENPSRKYVKLQKQMALNEIRLDPDLDEAERLVREKEIEEDYSFDSQVNYYESDVIVFENEKPVANPATVDLIQGLQISVDPADKGGLDGKYCIYGVDYKLLNNAEKERLRPLEATYSSLVTGEPTLDKAAKITWKIPLQHTMIHPPQAGKEFHFTTKKIDGTETTDEAIIEFLYSNGTRVLATEDQISGKSYPEDATHILITREGTEDYSQNDDTSEMQIEVKQYFRIKELYTPNESNNTIECIVLKNNIEYPASAQLTFGPQGTNGTNYTLTLEFDNNESCLYAKDKNGLGVTAYLFDYENKPIEDVTCSFSWYSGDGKKMEALGSKSMKTIVKVKDSYQNNKDLDYYILQGVINYGKATKIDEETGEETEIPGVDLTAYLPIPIKYDNSFTLAEGPTTIIYDNNGTNPTYYKGGLKIYKEDQSKPYQDENCFWQIVTNDEEGQEKGFYPFVRDNSNGISEVVATNSYYSKENSLGEMEPLKEVALQYIKSTIIDTENSSEEVLWTQPILIQQNRWPSAMLNKWDGTLQIDDKEGTILSQMVGAGYKDSQNRYNGVLMGNVNIALASDAAVSNATTENPVQAATRKNGTTGVYGFHQGAPSFGLMDNGTAFFGKAGAGQILIDGNKSTIQSSSYRNGTNNAEGIYAPKQQGMLIDLDNAKIDMQAEGESAAYVKIDTKTPYFKIAADVSGSAKTIMNVGITDYYMQTADYSKNDKQGMRVGLSEKMLRAYGADGGHVELTANGNPYFRVNNGSKNLINIGTGEYYLESKDYQETTVNSSGIIEAGKEGKGLKIDLTGNAIYMNSGKITLNDVKDGKNRSLILNSDAGLYPIRVNTAGERMFSVGWDGHMYSKDATVTGTITANDGKIGNWSINSGAIENGNVQLTSGGNLIASNVTLSGTITATAGTIGGAVIKDGVLKVEDANLGTVHLINLYLGNSKVTTKEVSVVTDVDFYAHQSGGAIANFKAVDMDSSDLIRDRVNVTLYPLYIKCSRITFTVLKAGNVVKDKDGANAGDYCHVSTIGA